MTDNPTLEPRGVENTDRELWWEQHEGYRTSIHVTRGGGIGINVGGSVIVKQLAEWHALEAAQRRVSELEAALLCVRPFLTTLTRQGEDNIWRPAKRLLAMIEEQIGPDRSAALAKDETARE